MSGLAAVLLFASMQIAFGVETFPICDSVLREFEQLGINLFINAERVGFILATECLVPFGNENRLQRVQFCPQGELAFAPPFSFQLDFEEGLSLSTIHDFDEIQARRGTDDAICLNAARVPIPPGRVPAGTVSCPPSNVPTRRSQYAADGENLCFTSCFFSISFSSARFLSVSRTNTYVNCCLGSSLVEQFRSFFSFFPPAPEVCI